ncbi:MAG TPA: hypothetical protein DEA32_00730 [Firmicutes bacterium]|nr:hypothetical protein [Bacillota bacterium]
MSEKDRVKRYESLRHKIQNQSYFALENPLLTPREEPDSQHVKPAYQVKHTVAQEPSPMQNTQDYKAIDETDHPLRGRLAGFRRRRLPERWRIWAILGVFCLLVAAAIIALAIVFSPRA